MNLEFYEISDEYIEYMKRFFLETMLDNKMVQRVHTRKYIGIILEVNGFKYFAPLSSPKKSDYISEKIRKSSMSIIRMVQKTKDRYTLLGTIKLNNMLPVPESEISKYDLQNEHDTKYKDLIMNELNWIEKNTTEIITKANNVYKFKMKQNKNISEKNIKFLNSIMPFREAEIKCMEYVNDRKHD